MENCFWGLNGGEGRWVIVGGCILFGKWVGGGELEG